MLPSERADSEAALQGSNQEVVAVLVENHRRFQDFLEKRVGSPEAAEEILQGAFTRAIERAGVLPAKESAAAWFFRVLRNALVDHHRSVGSSRREFATLDSELAAHDAETAQEICRCILSLADTLKPEYSAVLKRVEVEEISLQDFAAEAGITANNAAVRLFRAREALRKRVAATCRTCAKHGCLDCTCSPVARSIGNREESCKDLGPAPSTGANPQAT